jgi:hypothetical protein
MCQNVDKCSYNALSSNSKLMICCCSFGSYILSCNSILYPTKIWNLRQYSCWQEASIWASNFGIYNSWASYLLLSMDVTFRLWMYRTTSLENRDYTLYPQKLALTSLTSGGRSVGIVRSRTHATEFVLFTYRRKGLRVSENRWLRRQIEPKKEKVSGGCGEESITRSIIKKTWC